MATEIKTWQIINGDPSSEKLHDRKNRRVLKEIDDHENLT